MLGRPVEFFISVGHWTGHICGFRENVLCTQFLSLLGNLIIPTLYISYPCYLPSPFPTTHRCMSIHQLPICKEHVDGNSWFQITFKIKSAFKISFTNQLHKSASQISTAAVRKGCNDLLEIFCSKVYSASLRLIHPIYKKKKKRCACPSNSWM